MKAVQAAVTTVLAGALFGYVFAAFAGTFMAEAPLLGAHESPEAHAYMVGVMQNDPESLLNLQPSRDIASRAQSVQTSQDVKTQWQPTTLTYLGGASLGRVSVHMYAIGVRDNEGVERIIPLALTLVDRKVVRFE